MLDFWDQNCLHTRFGLLDWLHLFEYIDTDLFVFASRLLCVCPRATKSAWMLPGSMFSSSILATILSLIPDFTAETHRGIKNGEHVRSWRRFSKNSWFCTANTHPERSLYFRIGLEVQSKVMKLFDVPDWIIHAWRFSHQWRIPRGARMGIPMSVRFWEKSRLLPGLETRSSC